MNSSNELYILDKVKELYTSFPKGTINHTDSPDFIIRGLRNVGIEITQVFHDNDLGIPGKPEFISVRELKQEETEVDVVPNLKAEHLRVVLDKKEVAKKAYKKCDEYWLLIREGSFYSDSFDDIEITNIPYTSFDKVLLYRQSENLIVQLK